MPRKKQQKALEMLFHEHGKIHEVDKGHPHLTSVDLG